MTRVSVSSDIPNVSVLATEPSTRQLQPVRPKVKHACLSCKERKVRCDGRSPCASCVSAGVKCEYVFSVKSQSKKKKRKGSFVSVVSTESKKPRVEASADPRTSVDFKAVFRGLFPAVDVNDPKLDTESLISLVQSRHEQLLSNASSRLDGTKVSLMLPPKQISLTLIAKTWDSACLLFRFYHRPTFISVVESLYTVENGEYTDQQRRFLPLIYSVIAVGALFCKTYLPTPEHKQLTEFFSDEGHKFFVEAKGMLDPIDCKDVESLQALFMLTIFLQCNANLSSGYSYIGLALRTAIKQNYHRKSSIQHLGVLQQETIKRLFWTIYKTDIYMNCILGLPNSLDESLIDQDFPLDIDDDKILENKLLPQPAGKLSSVGMNNEHTKLLLMMKSTHKILYPMSLTVTSISHNEITKLETDLSTWLENLPYQLQPSFAANSDEYFPYVKPNRYLHLDYLHTRIMLYRPFIHYIVLDKGKFPRVQFQISMANRCIDTARKVIRLAVEMDEERLLNAVYWFSVHTIFFSVACLLYFVHQNQLKGTNLVDSAIEKDCRDGFNLLFNLKKVSVASSKTFEVLNSLFNKLNQKTMELSDTVLSNIIETQRKHEIEEFTQLSDLFRDTEVDESLFESHTSDISNITPDFEDDLLNKLLSQFSNELN